MTHKHHIIPKHMGGSDDPDNLISLSVENHAQAHKELFEKYGKLEDKLAWQGLLGIIPKEKIVQELCSRKGENNPMYGRRGDKHPLFGKSRPDHSLRMQRVMKGKVKSHSHQENWNISFRERSKTNPVATKNWKVITPTGDIIVVRNLTKFCKENSLNKGCMSEVANKKATHHKNYRVEKVL